MPRDSNPQKSSFIGSFLRTMFNGSMIGAAVLAWLIFGSIAKIERAYHHKGSVITEPENGSSRWAQSEARHKRSEYVTGAVMLVTGLCLWYQLAKALEGKSRKE